MDYLKTKPLLLLIAIALWGIFLQSLFAPIPVQAQTTSNGYAIAVDQGEMIIVANGKVSLWGKRYKRRLENDYRT